MPVCRGVAVGRAANRRRSPRSKIPYDRSVARNVDIAVRVSERRVKRFGMTPRSASRQPVTGVTQDDIALAVLVRQAPAAAAVAEA